MASVNCFHGLGRLTRDPETRTFASGGKVANFSLAINEKKKDQQTGQWVDDPLFLDCAAFNSNQGRKLADTVESYLRKGSQVFVEGKLKLESWTAQDGSKRSKMKLHVFDVQFLDSKRDNGDGGSNNNEEAPPSEEPPF